MTGGWRSALFVPGDDRRKIASAARSGADAVILDLEDGVPYARKEPARAYLREASIELATAGLDVIVRINAEWQAALTDLQSAVLPSVRAIMVPKAETAARIQVLTEMVEQLEQPRGLRSCSIKLLPLIETAAGLRELDVLADLPNLCGLALGSEDFSLSLGVPPTPECLDLPSRLICLAARRRGLMALAIPSSIAAFREIDEFEAATSRARLFGATGALCIHPSQVTVASRVFRPAEEELRQARAILDAWEVAQAGGNAVTSFEGKMIDAPVAARAFRLIGKSIDHGL